MVLSTGTTPAEVRVVTSWISSARNTSGFSPAPVSLVPSITSASPALVTDTSPSSPPKTLETW